MVACLQNSVLAGHWLQEETSVVVRRRQTVSSQKHVPSGSGTVRQSVFVAQDLQRFSSQRPVRHWLRSEQILKARSAH